MQEMQGVLVFGDYNVLLENLLTASGISLLFIKLFKYGEENLNEKVKGKFKRELKSKKMMLLYMEELFDSTFTKKHLSWRFFFRSCVASVFWLVLLSFIFLIFSKDSTLFYEVNKLDFFLYIFPAGLLLNIVPDYLSLIQTRYFLGRMTNAHSYVVVIFLLLDLIFSIVIFLTMIALLLLLPEEGGSSYLWKFMEVYNLDVAAEYLGYSQPNISYLDKVYFFFDNFFSMDKPSFVLVFLCALTTLSTSIWIWLHCLAGLFFKLLSWTKYEQQPFEQFGKTFGGGVFFISFIVLVLLPRESKFPEMVLIPGGSFEMGCMKETGCKSTTLPAHKVTLDEFRISRYEVTFNQYFQFTRDKKIALPSDEGFGRGSRPVLNVSWSDAKEYINWLNQNDSTRGDWEYFLPTEAQWEYVAKANSRTSYHWGDFLLQENANCGRGSNLWGGRRTTKVGTFKANDFGVYDMSGNVWEWVEDSWHKNYYGAPNDGSAWSDKKNSKRVLRGGSSISDAELCYSTFRYSGELEKGSGLIGVRVVQLKRLSK